MSSIKKNLVYQTFYEILILILPLFTSPYISRVMGAEYLGIYSYTNSIAYYFQMFGMLGIKFYGNRAIAKTRNNKRALEQTFNEIFALHAFLSGICFLAYLGYSLYLSEYKIYAVLQGLVVLAAIFDVSWLFFGLEKFKATATRSSIIKVISVVCIFMFVKGVNDFYKYIIILAGGQFLNSFVLFALSFKEVHYSFPDLHSLKKHVKPLFLLFIPILALSLFKYMDKIMLGNMGNKNELGYYENAEKVLNIPLSVVFSFGSVMLPRISNIISKDNDAVATKYLSLSIKYMVGLSFAMAFGLAAISSVFAPVFWGQQFTRSGSLIALLAVSIPFSTIASIIRNQDMIPNGHDKYYSYSIVAGAIINLLINYLLIPKFQALGVTLGTVVAEIVVCVFELWFVKDSHEYKKMLMQPFVFLIPSAVMYVVVYLIGYACGLHIYTLAIQVFGGVIVFALITIIMLVITKDPDAKRAFQMLKARITGI